MNDAVGRTETTSTPSGGLLTSYIPGCDIPLPSDRKTKRRSTSVEKDERGGQVPVTRYVYEPISDFTFTRQAFFITLEKRKVPERRFRLVWIEELRAGENIFGYNIFAEPVETEGSDNSAHNHRNIYLCYDSDGDGNFEYLINNSGAPPHVPLWVVSKFATQ